MRVFSVENTHKLFLFQRRRPVWTGQYHLRSRHTAATIKQQDCTTVWKKISREVSSDLSGHCSLLSGNSYKTTSSLPVTRPTHCSIWRDLQFLLPSTTLLVQSARRPTYRPTHCRCTDLLTGTSCYAASTDV
jgi:hypothetical protein